MAAERLEKIYDLKEIGGESVLGMVNAINQSFAQLKRTKQGLSRDSLKTSFDGDTEAVRKQKEQFEQLRLKEYEMRIERQQLVNQAQQLKNIRQQELQQQRNVAAGNEAVAGSYNDIAKQYRQLLAATKNNEILDSASLEEAKLKLKALKSQLDDFNRSLTSDGTLVGEYSRGIIKAFSDMGLDDLIKRQVDNSKAQLDKLDKEFNDISAELRNIQATGVGSFEALERQLIENRQAAAALNTQITNIENELLAVRQTGDSMTSALKKGFQDLSNQAKGLITNFIGLYAAFAAIQRGVGDAKELSDQTTNLEIELGKAAGGADNLVTSLANLNTRTTLAGLEEIANIAVRAGVSEQNLVGVTEAIDKIKIAFGRDFGQVETGTETLVKLINIFEGAGSVTGDSLLRTGNALRVLANESVASVPFLNDFAQRMAGLKGISDITLPSVLGLASGFEQFGQSAEVSSTALVRIIPKLAEDAKKFADVLGITKEQFAELLNSRPEEALIRVSEALVQGKGSIEEISTAFADSELGKGRVTSILGVLGKNADAFRHSIETAGTAYTNTSDIQDAFIAKNENLAATLDKLTKKFADAANNKAFQVTLLVLGTLISGLISSLPLLIAIITTYGIVWGVANAAMIKANVATLYSNVLFKAQYAWLVLSETWTKAYAAALTLYTNRQRAAAAATQLFNTAVRENPLSTVLVVLGLVIAAFQVFGGILTDSSDKVRKHANDLTMQAEAMQIANDNTTEQINKLNVLVAVAKDVKNSDDTRRQSMRELIALYPQFSKALNGEIISLKALSDAYMEVTGNIRLMAETQAAAQLSAQRMKSVLEVTSLRQQVEVQSSGSDPFSMVKLDNLSDAERSMLLGGVLGNSVTNNTSLRGGPNNSVSFYAKDKDAIVTFLRDIENQRTESYNQYSEFAAKKTVELTESEARQKQEVKKSMEGSANLTVGQKTDYLKSEIKDLEEAYSALNATDKAGQEKNIAQRQDLQKQLDAIDTKKTSKAGTTRYGGARLDGQTKDLIKEAETTTALLKAELEKRKLDGAISEYDYYVELNRITQQGIDQKLSVIGNGNAEEKKQRAEIQLEAVRSEKEMNDNLFKIEEKAANDRLNSQTKSANNELQLSLAKATATEQEKADAQLSYDQAALDAQIEFGNSMDVIEKRYSQRSKENAVQRSDEILEKERKLAADRIALAEATIKTLNTAIEQGNSIAVSTENQDYYQRQQDIYENLMMGEVARRRQLEQLEREHQAKMLGIQSANLNLQRSMQDKALIDGLISVDEYRANVEKINEQIAQNAKDQSQNSYDAWKKSQEGLVAALGLVAQELDRINRSVLQPMFDIQSQRIDNEQKLTEAQLDEQKKRELALTSNKEEQKRIEDKYEKMKSDDAKRYGEERRQIALKELAIESAVAAIRAFSEGMKTGGPWVGAAYVGLVGVQYILQRQKIMEQQFEDGGSLKKVLGNGGRFQGPSHRNGGIGFMFGGRNTEVEGEEGYVINKRSMSSGRSMTVTGTPAQIASAANIAGGGINFAPGWQIMKFDYGGRLGQMVQPPVFNSYIPAQASMSENEPLLNLMWAQINSLKDVNSRIDNIQVIVSAKSMSDQQNKTRKAVSVGTL